MVAQVKHIDYIRDLRALLSVALCICVLLLSIPAPSAKAIVIADDIAYILLATLAAFGISVTAVAGIEDVGPWIVDQFEEYVNSLSDTLDTVWSKIRYGVSKAGDLILNGFGLRYSANFAEWLQDKFSLTDDSSAVDGGLSGGLFYGPYPCFPVPTLFSSGSLSPLGIISSSSPDTYFLVFYTNSQHTYVGLVPFSRSSFSYTYTLRYSTITRAYSAATSSDGTFYDTARLVLDSGYAWPDSSLICSFEDYRNLPTIFSSGYSVSSEPSTPVITMSSGSISIPTTGDYTDDDGVLIDGIGSWGDTLQDIKDWLDAHSFPDTVDNTASYDIASQDGLLEKIDSWGLLSTENSPGFATPGGLPEFSFSGVWHYVTDWISSFSGFLSVIVGIAFAMPAVSIVYAVLVLSLAIWLIRKVS